MFDQYQIARCRANTYTDGPKPGENPRVFLFARPARKWKHAIFCTLLFASVENTNMVQY
jgi:hypothetical protein